MAEAQVLYSEDGPRVMVPGADPAEILKLAAELADAEDLVVLDTSETLQVGHIRATPCRPGGHDVDGWPCDGDYRCHYRFSRPGPGSFRGAFVEAATNDLRERP